MKDVRDDFDFFNTPPDPQEDQDALLASLRMADDFVLLFAITNSATERNDRMNAVTQRFPGKNIRRIVVDTETENLLWRLRAELTDSKPDAVFVYGLENWISGADDPRSIPLLRNLNAARDSFPPLLPAPMVFWVPQYVLKAIADAAPDFFSVRSGVYTFPLDPAAREEIASTLTQIDYTEVMGYSVLERTERIHELRGLLAEYRNLPSRNRDPLSEANLMNSLGMQLLDECQYGEAETLLAEALEVHRKILASPHSNIAINIGNLAVLYRMQGRYDESERMFEESLSIHHAVLPYPHKDVATSLNNRAGLYQTLGRYNEAELLYTEALQISRAISPDAHNDIATSLNNLASLYEDQNRFQEAESLYLEALSTRRTVLHNPHDNTATLLNNIAGLYRRQGRYKDAEIFYDEALSMRQRILPHPNRRTAASLHNVGGLYHVQGRYEKSESFYKEALAILRTVLTSPHYDIAKTLNNLAGLYRSQRRYDEALPLYQEAVAIMRKVLGENHPNTKVIAGNLQQCLSDKRDRLLLPMQQMKQIVKSKKRRFVASA